MKILLLGGTGALGTYLIDSLASTDAEIYVTSRKPHQSFQNIHYILGNAKETSFLEDVISNKFDCIVDFMIWPSGLFETIYSKILNKTGQYIFTSSYRAYANSGLTPLNENSPLLIDTIADSEYLKTDEYALAKGRCEKILASSLYKNYTIIRPSITFSKQRFQIGTLEAGIFIPRSVRNEPIIFPESMLSKRAAISWAGDVGNMIAALIGQKEALQETFNVGSAESYTWKQIIEFYHNLLNVNVKLTTVQDYIDVIGGQYQVKYDRMFDRVFDNTKILKFMGKEQKDLKPIKIALKEEIAKLDFSAIQENTKVSQRIDKYLESHKLKTLLFHPPIKCNNENLKKASEQKKDLNRNKTIGILNFHFANNYGAVLVPFALKRAIESIGYKVEIINYVGQKFSRQPAFVEFRGKYLHPISKEFLTVNDLKEYTDHWDCIVVGSDQVWRMFDTSVYMLKWATGNSTFISYAASFGHDKFEGSIPSSEACQLLNRFDAISVREESGVTLCQKIFGVNALQVLDPTFLLSRKTYEKLIDEGKFKKQTEPYILGIFLSAKSSNFVANQNLFLSLRSKYKFINVIKDSAGKYRSVSEWLYLIKNAKYIITDSFHGAVFSIIFEKQFIALMHEGFNGNARIPSLLKGLGISESRIYSDIKDIDIHSFDQKIDYKIVNEILLGKRNLSFKFLKDALMITPNQKAEVETEDLNQLMQEIDVFNARSVADEKTRATLKRFQLKIIELSNLSKEVEELKQEIDNLKKRTTFTLFQFCIYWTYRFLFRVSRGKLKQYFKQKRAYYRNIVRGPIEK